MMAKSALALFYAEAGQKKNTIQMDGVLFALQNKFSLKVRWTCLQVHSPRGEIMG
jgi:hypothetical protein